MTFVIQTPSKPWGGSFCIQCESKMIRKVPSFSPFQVGQKCFVRDNIRGRPLNSTIESIGLYLAVSLVTRIPRQSE